MKKKERRASLPRLAAETRASLLEKMYTPAHLTMLKSMMATSISYKENLFDPAWEAVDVAHRMADTASKASLFTVTADMWNLVKEAAETMPPETLLPQDLPSRSGWLYLDEPHRLVDVGGDPYDIQAIMWNEEVIGHDGYSPGIDSLGEPLPSSTSGIVVYGLVANQDLRTIAPGSFMRDLPQLGMMTIMTSAYGKVAWELDTELNTHTPEFLKRNWRSSHDGTIIKEYGKHRFLIRTADGIEVNVRHAQLMVLLKAFFALLRTELIDESREMPPRGTTKSLPEPLRDRDITVIDLRKIKREHPSKGGGSSMRVRTIRRGHWRRTWCGSGEARYQRWTYIYAYVAGPKDAPWSKTTVVNQMRR